MGSSKPGVMLYFDLRPCLQRLTNEQKGVLLTAILDYAEDGEIPEIDDIAVGIAWDFIKPRIDRDAEAYAGKVEKAKAAAGKRWNVPTHADALSGNAEQCEAMPKMPTSSSTSTSTTTSNGEKPPPAAPPRKAKDQPARKSFSELIAERTGTQ